MLNYSKVLVTTFGRIIGLGLLSVLIGVGSAHADPIPLEKALKFLSNALTTKLNITIRTDNDKLLNLKDKSWSRASKKLKEGARLRLTITDHERGKISDREITLVKIPGTNKVGVTVENFSKVLTAMYVPKADPDARDAGGLLATVGPIGELTEIQELLKPMGIGAIKGATTGTFILLKPDKSFLADWTHTKKTTELRLYQKTLFRNEPIDFDEASINKREKERKKQAAKEKKLEKKEAKKLRGDKAKEGKKLTRRKGK